MVFIAADSHPQWSWVNPKINEWVLVLWRLLSDPSSTRTLQFSSRTPHNQGDMQHKDWFLGGPTWSQQLDSTITVGPFQLGILYSYGILHAKWNTALTWGKKIKSRHSAWQVWVPAKELLNCSGIKTPVRPTFGITSSEPPSFQTVTQNMKRMQDLYLQRSIH